MPLLIHVNGNTRLSSLLLLGEKNESYFIICSLQQIQ